jgi:hypothetical protein
VPFLFFFCSGSFLITAPFFSLSPLFGMFVCPDEVAHCYIISPQFRRFLSDEQLAGHIQGGSNMTGTNCDLFTHKSSRSYLNHLVISKAVF